MTSQRRTITTQSGASTKSSSSRAPRTRAKSQPALDAPAQSAVVTLLDRTERDQLIALAAYFRAEKRGFTPGGHVEDWLEAEKEVDRQWGG